MPINRDSILFITLMILLTLVFYRQQPELPQTPMVGLRTFVVAGQANNSTLYFSGIVTPAQIFNVTSPVESVVTKMHFAYGQQVKKGDVLFVLNSNQLRQDYQNALAEFLKAKEHYVINQAQLEGVEELNRLGIISKNEYTSNKSNYNDSALSYSQARQKLLDIMQKVQGLKDNITQLDLSDYVAVNKALTAGIKDIEIKSPATGVALLPEKTGGGGADDAGQKVDVGSQIKNGQRLLSIGDMSGISVDIKVNEVDINRLKLGQEVVVTGAGFPDVELHGQVKSIDVQAVAESGSVPTFPIKVLVQNLTDAQRKVIHVGMSTKVEIHLQQSNALMIPIRAVSQKNGKTWVKVIAPNNQIHEVEVITGQTTPVSVEIKSGLQAGDNIVVAD